MKLRYRSTHFSFKGADRRGLVTAMVAQGTLGFGKIFSPAHDQATYLLNADCDERVVSGNAEMDILLL